MNAIITLLLASAVLGGPTDWVNPEYAKWSASNSGPGSSTYDSRNSIIAAAQSSAKSGPWSVTYSTVYPPSNDTRDYLSWAPYHWPNCNWCNEEKMQSDPSSNGSPDTPNDSSSGNEFFRQPRRLKRVRRRDFVQETSVAAIATASSEIPEVSYPTAIPGANSVQSALTSLDDPAPTTSPNATDSPAGDSYEKTSVNKPSATRTSKSSCTPSPTTYMAPSATWTTCPYVARDGIVNPDVRSLRPPGAFNDVSEAIIYNAIAYALTGVSGYSQNVATFINTFFLDNETGMKPNMNFGQVIRGPGHSGQSGTFAGILDARGMTKVANSILMLRQAKSPDWSDAKDSQMMIWATAYTSWLANSPSGQGAASRPNNHATFYTLQLASVQVVAGDYDGARGTMNNFLKKNFPDQIAHSGEQPFEAVRTRPFHYRCFNLEALIALAKLGEMLDMNLWTTRSKYGTTIQDAVDYTMTVNPGKENLLELGPHVAAAAAAYGDPNGKYAAFLGKTDAGYKSKPYWFFDQPNALRGAKGGKKVWTIEGTLEEIGFDCPGVFSEPGVRSVALDDGVFVTCDELRPFYETEL